MAYKQTPGRSPFLKTGRDIPLNMISPLHDHKPDHKGELSEDDIMNDPALIKTGGDVGITGHTQHQTDKLNKELQYQIRSSSGISTGFSNKTINPDDVRNDPWFQKNRPLDKNPKIKQIEDQLERGGKGMIPSKK